MRDLIDAQWAILRPLRPPHNRTGRQRADDRSTSDAILYVLRTGCAWRDLPAKYGDDSTAHRRLQRWKAEGVWQRIHRTLLGMPERMKRIDRSWGLLDGSFIPAKRGRCGWPARQRKWHTAHARHRRERAPDRYADHERGRRRGPHGGDDTRDDRLAAEEGQAEVPPAAPDRGQGYDRRKLRRSLHQRGIRPCIPPKRRPGGWKPRQGRPVKHYTEEYRRRWPVERTFARLGHQRRLLVWHEHKAEDFHAF